MRWPNRIVGDHSADGTSALLTGSKSCDRTAIER